MTSSFLDERFSDCTFKTFTGFSASAVNQVLYLSWQSFSSAAFVRGESHARPVSSTAFFDNFSDDLLFPLSGYLSVHRQILSRHLVPLSEKFCHKNTFPPGTRTFGLMTYFGSKCLLHVVFLKFLKICFVKKNYKKSMNSESNNSV